MEEEMMTSEQGIKLYAEVGLSENTFYRNAREGKIKKTLPEGRQRDALYRAEDIRTIVEFYRRKRKDRVQAIRTKKEERGKTDWVQAGDLPYLLALDLNVYREASLGDINLYMSWLKRNPRLTMAAFAAPDREKVLAYLTLLPVPESTALTILRGEKRVARIRPEEIETYEREGGYTLLAQAIAARPEHSAQVNTVLKKFMEYWCSQYPKRHIEKIYAQAATDKGDILIQKLFFAPRYDLAEGAYELDLKRPAASRFIRRLQRCMGDKGQK
jgi:hypothetical protein